MPFKIFQNETNLKDSEAMVKGKQILLHVADKSAKWHNLYAVQSSEINI